MSVQRLELKTNLGSRIVFGFLLSMVILLLVLLGKTTGIVISGALVAGFVWLCAKLGKRRLIVEETGVTIVGMSSTKRLGWDDVDHYTYWSMDQQGMYVNGGQAGAIGAIIAIAIIASVRALRRNKNQNRRFGQGRMTLIGRDGTKLKLDPVYKGVADALDIVFAQVHPRLRARPDGTSNFAPFTLGDTQLVHAKKGGIGLADIEKLGAGSNRITVKKRDKRLAWANERMSQVKNVMLFLEAAAEHGLVVVANAEVFMPHPVLEKLKAASSRQAAMPKARVVQRN